MGRLLAIGDIHGCFAALECLFSFAQIDSADQLVFLGDYVDRGPESKLVLEFLIRLSESRPLVALRGNHEVMMLDASLSQDNLQRWYGHGGSETLVSYARDADEMGTLSDIPEKHWEFLSGKLSAYHETDSHIFVHGLVSPSLSMAEQPDSALYWSAYWEQFPGHQSGKTVICGHKAQANGFPATNGAAICIDTGAWKGGWLTCLDVESKVVWQANQRRETRQFELCCETV